MRLLLDEHFSPEIARQLRDKGHDVVAVKEQPDLIGRADRVHFALAPQQRRAIVTKDLADFRPLLASALRKGQRVYGIVCVSANFRLNRSATGGIVRALERLLAEYSDDETLVRRGGETWL